MLSTGHLLPILALFSFLLADYFSSFVIAILLTVVIKTLYLDQILGTTRTLIIDTLWITAIIATGIKVLKSPNSTIVGKRSFLQSISNHSVQESLIPLNDQTSELSVKFWHDLQTPVKMILGLCQAIMRTDHNQGQAIPLLHRDNVQAIYRNAQQLEKMIDNFSDRLKPVHIPDAEELDPVVLIQETATLIQDLMAANGITLEIKLGDSLPKLRLDRITIRQVLLNMLCTLVRANGLSGIESVVTVRAQGKATALHIIVTALSTNIHSAAADANWRLNERLLERVGGRLWLEADPNSGGYSSIVVTFPLSTAPSTARPLMPGLTSAVGHPNVLVISEESKVVDLFKKQLSQYTVIGIKNINAFYLSAAPVQAVAVILTREQHTSHLEMISTVVDKHTPIIICPIASAQEQLQRLNAIYLPKPVDADALSSMFANATAPIASVLIVDDNLDSAEMLARMLVAISPTLVNLRAYLAQDALLLLDTNPIDAIIIDVFLPDMDGLALVEHLRSQERFAHLLIVLISAQPNPDFIRPVIATDTISLFQRSPYQANQIASYVEALINVTGAGVPV